MVKRDPNAFKDATKRKILERAGYMCSDPNCNAQLIGPHTNPNGSVLTGEVAHIKGAHYAPNNRYDANMTPDHRRHHSNAIALCENHAKLIDTDQIRFPADLLYKWKSDHEKRVSLMQKGDLQVEEEYFDKPYEKCTADELRTERAHRFKLIGNAKVRKNKTNAFKIIFPILAILGADLLNKIAANPSGFIYIYILIGIFLLIKILNKRTDVEKEFIWRQKEHIKEINFRLRERGEE